MFSCEQCQYKDSSEAGVKNHQDTVHKDTEYIQSTSKGDLAQQKRAVHEGVKYPCGQCDYQASSTGNLARHKRAVHEGVKYPCGQCGYHATLKLNLDHHKRAVHEGVIFPCRQRGHQSTSKGSLA